MVALIGGEEMDYHIAVIEHQPALLRLAFHTAFFLVLLFRRLDNRLGQRVEHTVAGAVTYDKIIGERCNVFDVEKQDVFTLFVLQGFDDFMSKFESVQISPLYSSHVTPALSAGASVASRSLAKQSPVSKNKIALLDKARLAMMLFS